MIDENGNVTIKYKCYKRKIRTTETMSGEEFVRRFMLHIVPNGVHRIRCGGIFQGKGRKARLDQCRDLLIEYNESNDLDFHLSSTAQSTTTPPASTQPDTEPKQADIEPKQVEPKQAERNLPKCARCKTPEMRSNGFQDATTTRALIAISQRVIALYALSWTTLEDWSEYFRKNVRIKKEI